MKLSNKDKNKYLCAQSLINSADKSQNEKGVQFLSELVEVYPSLGKLRAVYANSLWAKGDRDLAMREFQKATVHAPKSKIVSLGLFHILWEQGKENDAFEEMERLTSLGVRCEDYEEIVREINDKGQ